MSGPVSAIETIQKKVFTILNTHVTINSTALKVILNIGARTAPPYMTLEIEELPDAAPTFDVWGSEFRITVTVHTRGDPETGDRFYRWHDVNDGLSQIRVLLDHQDVTTAGVGTNWYCMFERNLRIADPGGGHDSETLRGVAQYRAGCTGL